MAAMMEMGDLGRARQALEIEDLSIIYGHGPAPLRAVRNISLTIAPGEAYGLIGESGSGKTSVAYAIMRYLRGEQVAAKRIALRGRDLMRMPVRDLQGIRGRQVAMVYQDPLSALNPVLTVGEQIAEVLRRHRGMSRSAAWDRVVDLFGRVHLPNPSAMALRYPHQLSGGQQQRVVIAMAIACEPDMLIMDEPTTGLDVTTEAIILELVRELRQSIGASVLFISHNLGVVANICDRVGVLYAGHLIEEGPVRSVLTEPQHPYTAGLLAAIPRPEARQHRLHAIPGRLPDLRHVPVGCIFKPRCAFATTACDTMPPVTQVAAAHVKRCHLDVPATTSLEAIPRHVTAPATAGTPRLSIEGLSKWFGGGALLRRDGDAVKAVNDITLAIQPGQTLAIVGESGSGKSTLARCVAGLLQPTHGRLLLDGQPLAATVQRRSRAQQQAIQFIFQNPESSLNPHHTVEEVVGRPLKLYGDARGAELRRRVTELLEIVKLDGTYAKRYPREMSGGEKQRLCIARAFAANPSLVICDEPTSALDISVQAAILNELVELQQRFGTSYLFISHDLAVVQHVADSVAVMYSGHLLEQGTPQQVFSAPHHPYTEALLAAVPRLDGVRRPRLERPTAAARTGCVYHRRCGRRLGEECDTVMPALHRDTAGHVLACHAPADILQQLQA
jgi:peptide/nickel transport system ATP-binding protein